MNCRFRCADLEPLNLEGDYDLAFCSNTAHDLASPAAFFAALAPHIREKGTFVLHELHAEDDMAVNVHNPLAPGILAFSLLHCVPLALNKDPTCDAPGGMWGRQRYVEALNGAGFASVRCINLPEDPANDLIIAQKDAYAKGAPSGD